MINLNDRIIPELDILWKTAFTTSKATLEENMPIDNPKTVYENIRFAARTILIPLKEKFTTFSSTWISSWYRNPTVNGKVSGAENSNHLTGSAIDIRIPITDIFKRGVNSDIFYFLLDYFTVNTINYDELIWEVQDDKFKLSPKAKEFPQWIHVAVKKSGNRKRLSSIGVDKKFNTNRVIDGLSNKGRTNNTINIKIVYDRIKPEAKKQDKKYIQCISSYISLQSMQVDLVDTKSLFYPIRIGFMYLGGGILENFLGFGGIGKLTTLMKPFLTDNKSEIKIKRNDSDYLTMVSDELRTQKSIEKQIEFFINTFNIAYDKFAGLSLKDPLLCCFLFDLLKDNKIISDFRNKESIQSVNTDGSWLDYYLNIQTDITISEELKRKYNNIIDTYFIEIQ